VSFLAVIAALWWWRPTATANHRSAESFWSALQSGLRHARSNPALRHTLARAVLFYIFASAYWALLPLIAREQLHGGPKLFGILVGCIGAGAVGGALLLPRLRSRWSLERIVHAATLLTTACLAGFALLHAPLAGMLTAVAAGAAWIAALASVNVAAQLAVPDAMRARGMGIYTMVFYGCLASGSLLWGQVATRVHVPTTLLIAASCMALTLIPARHLNLRPE
jgi:predicted MFS family arabinose efflux permease